MDRRDSDYRRVLGLQSYLELGLPHRGRHILSLFQQAFSQGNIAQTNAIPPQDRFYWDTNGVVKPLVLGHPFGKVLPAPQKAGQVAGHAGKAKELLLRFRAEIAEMRVSRLLPNIDAMHCRLSLLDESTFAAVWYSELAPNEGTFFGMERYRYLTKARCYIKHREHHAALLLLGRILDYTQRYARPLDMLETLILISICRYRMESEGGQQYAYQQGSQNKLHFRRALGPQFFL